MIYIKDYDIHLYRYHDSIAGRLVYRLNGTHQESSLYSMDELTNTILLWKEGLLKGNFGIGTCLVDNADMYLIDYGFID